MYLSYVINQSIKDPTGAEVGRLVDLVASPAQHIPVISAVLVRGRRRNTFAIASSAFQYDRDAEKFHLAVNAADAPRYEISDEDLLLKTNVMDKQIVDVHEYRVVRVNDVRIEPSGDRLYLVGVDTGTRGLLRRMGLMKIADKLARVTNIKTRSKVIGWHDVETFERGMGRLKLRVSAEKLQSLHPTDIARIVNELDPDQRQHIIETLDVEMAADVIGEAHPEIQASILEGLEDELAADILEEMEPDEAADILGDLDEERREDLLEEMQPEEAEDVKELLAFDDDSAGGLMTTEFITISKDTTAQETIDRIRELSPETELVYYLYVTDSSDHLVGVITLKDLIVAQPQTPVEEFMIENVVHVHLDASIEDIGQTISDYNLLAVPVVDDENRIRGVVTFDDLLEEIVPDEWKKRVPRLWRS